jgi:hypothetical protein
LYLLSSIKHISNKCWILASNALPNHYNRRDITTVFSSVIEISKFLLGNICMLFVAYTPQHFLASFAPGKENQ